MNASVSGVYKAIHAVQVAIGQVGIAKGHRNEQQRYMFRGIDDIYNALSPLLSEHGLLILPRMVERTQEERATKSGGTLFYVTVAAEFDFVAVEDGTVHVCRTYGEAMDAADKATNKAMSAAYKYACMQAFAIPIEGTPDADAFTPEPSTTIVQPRLNGQQEQVVIELSERVIEKHHAGQDTAAYELATTITEPRAKQFLWDLLEPYADLRRAIREMAHADSQPPTG